MYCVDVSVRKGKKNKAINGTKPVKFLFTSQLILQLELISIIITAVDNIISNISTIDSSITPRTINEWYDRFGDFFWRH